MPPRTPWDNAEPFISEHFVVSAEPGITQEEYAPIIRRMGAQKASLQHQFFPALGDTKINVLLFKDMTSYKRYRLLPLESLADYERVRRRISITLGSPPYVWRHEMTHALLEASRPDLPYWVQEGLALFLQNYDVPGPVRCDAPSLAGLTPELVPYLGDVRRLPVIDPTSAVDYEKDPARAAVQLSVPALFIVYIWQSRKLTEYLEWLVRERKSDPLFFFTHGNMQSQAELMRAFRSWVFTDGPARRLPGC